MQDLGLCISLQMHISSLFQVVYTQSFPEKFLNGEYEFEGTILGPRMKNRGKFDLGLCEYTI